MRLNRIPSFPECPRLNYGGAWSRASRIPYRATGRALFACLVLLFAEQAIAQQANQPGFDPRQTEKHFDDLQSGEGQPAKPALRLPTFAKPEVAADGKPLFVLRAVTLQGAFALPPDQLATAYQPYLGKPVSPADLAAMASSISDLYRTAGFHLTRAIIPPQDIQNGLVRIRIIEGSITELVLTGDGAEQFGVRPLLDPVLAERPSRLATLERQLLLINTRPGVRITDSQLEEIGGTTGHFRLIVQLKIWHVYAYVGLDNLGSASIGPWQTYATGAFNSYLLPGDSLMLNLSTIANDPRELGFGRLSYDVPVGVDGFRIGASALYSDARPGDDRRLTNDTTRTKSVEVHGSIVPVLSQQQTLTLTVAAGFTNASEKDIFSPMFGPIYSDRIRTVSLTSDYRLQDAFGGTNYATMTYRQGLDIFGATPFGDDFASRTGAAPNFSVLDFYYTRYQTLSDAWSVKVSTASQIASGPLYTSQQFYLGGWAFGRGYGAAEISGDNGLAGSFELRFD
jgi:hemolysin activation/secretion protein